MTVFVDDAIAGDALAVAEDELRHGDIKVVPAGNQIVEQMRKYNTGPEAPESSTGGMFVISERQVEALAELADWFADPELGIESRRGARNPPTDGVGVIDLAREIMTEPAGDVLLLS